MLNPKSNPLRDKKYRDSFKKTGEHICLISGSIFPDAAHIRHGFFATGMKPDDSLIMPLRHDLHMEQHDIGEVQFYIKYFNQIPEHMRLRAFQEVKTTPDNRRDIMEIIKQIARNYYKEWKHKQ